ncbi:pyridoxal phosphate-dependent decarboxylase family protein [Paludifilum halophilum]|uniref:Aspartate aminotransferase family protein n=1 Tax=Paludifilum halophilum TaxID=1642702 RepID=A0A235B2K1_9BACL|nr:aspartate aminotransferase family protein [Paludifilum halophilum]OYD06472.1 aspartate aminotransferase family protein [Paludifilum halophilum]
MTTQPSSVMDHLFLNETADSRSSYRRALNAAHNVILDQFARLPGAFSGREANWIASRIEHLDICPEAGTDIEAVLEQAGKTVVRHSVAVHHPACAAHLHCPPLIPSLAAEALISSMNQSMDSWDQSPAATLLEQRMIRWLCGLFRYGGQADGVFTSGGTQSNFMALLLARDHFSMTRLDWNVQKNGLPPQADRLRILCSEAAHFTIRQAAALLGLGQEAVVSVKTDANHRMSLKDLDRQLADMEGRGLIPFALVGTAGTTDFGSIDPLPELAARAGHRGLWFHVDAAYGGALALSDRYSHRLAGMDHADSIAVDFHKLFYQPISCGAFLTKESAPFDRIKLNADYLNPEEEESQDTPNLVDKSIQTTRRFDALKLFISLRTLGRNGFSRMIENTLETAREAARLMTEDPRLEVINPSPELNAVVFRYLPRSAGEGVSDSEWQDQLNRRIRHSLLSEGKAVIAQTKVDGATCLKLTLLNPRTTPEDIQSILEEVKLAGFRLEKTKGECFEHVPLFGTAGHHAEFL